MSFGAVQHAISVMKSNRSLLKKHRKRGFGLTGNESGKTEYNLPKASKHDIIKLRTKLQKEQKQRRTKQVVLLSVLLIVIISTLIYFA